MPGRPAVAGWRGGRSAGRGLVVAAAVMSRREGERRQRSCDFGREAATMDGAGPKSYGVEEGFGWKSGR
ncbi:hypothetical protein Nepgr_012143 [Nepenthes gracilis]|uniref:Uncharacterized protein n=1 Tax=Nepenthes gracilis TaxID=150966 RepID=A0AAD3XMK4_NEPGR|nr:hypothetical protein Nepgr_012143 [Nepenthes gracilis]